MDSELLAIARTLRGAVLPGAGDVHGELAALEVLVMEHLHGFVGLVGAGVVDEGEPSGFACELVHHEADATDGSRFTEEILEVCLRRLVTEVANEQS